VAESLARYLKARLQHSSPDWAVFDRNLVEEVLEDHNLPRRLARFMPEDRVHDLADAFDELLGAHPSAWTLVQQSIETILRLANQGNVILIGRGSHAITARLPHVFHARLVGSLERRVEHIQEIRGVGKLEALALIRREDRGRQRYLKRYFGTDINDLLSYHLVVNTDFISYEGVARLIGEAALEHLHASRRRAAPPEPAFNEG
jgi:cytidylate kinase